MKEKVAVMAGYMRELHAWQLLSDISKSFKDKGCEIAPDNIFWNGNSFELESDTQVSVSAEKVQVWNLGAAIFYLFMGCPVFNGQGMKAQKEDSPLPYMRKGMAQLSEFVQSMLRFDSALRPSMADIHVAAQDNMERLRKTTNSRPLKHDISVIHNSINDFWPYDFE